MPPTSTPSFTLSGWSSGDPLLSPPLVPLDSSCPARGGKPGGPLATPAPNSELGPELSEPCTLGTDGSMHGPPMWQCLGVRDPLQPFWFLRPPDSPCTVAHLVRQQRNHVQQRNDGWAEGFAGGPLSHGETHADRLSRSQDESTPLYARQWGSVHSGLRWQRTAGKLSRGGGLRAVAGAWTASGRVFSRLWLRPHLAP